MSFSERNKPCLHSAVCSTSIHVVMWYNFLFPFFFSGCLVWSWFSQEWVSHRQQYDLPYPRNITGYIGEREAAILFLNIFPFMIIISSYTDSIVPDSFCLNIVWSKAVLGNCISIDHYLYWLSLCLIQIIELHGLLQSRPEGVADIIYTYVFMISI